MGEKTRKNPVGTTDLLVRIVAVKGTCPIYKPGDSFWIRDGFRLQTSPGQSLCLHALSSLMPFYRALAGGVSPEEMGLPCRKGKGACVQCPDAVDFTDGGTVTFEILPVENALSEIQAEMEPNAL